MNCRHCGKLLEHTFLDLGYAPPSNAYLKKEDLNKPEKYYPLKVMVCDSCWLVQTIDYPTADELFTSDYAYFSSTSSTWLEHAKKYTIEIVNELRLTSDSFVIEVASNDGYLLKNFVEKGIPCLGIEPTNSTADAAEIIGISVIRKFFGQELASDLAAKGKIADLIIGNNVFAHVPDINDFTVGLKYALKPGGVITLEFPHLLQLVENNQFDTIYHEHFSYLSLIAVNRIFESAGLRVWKVDELSTHGGSLRIYGCHFEDPRENHVSVNQVLKKELSSNLNKLIAYSDFQSRVYKIKNDFLEFLINQFKVGKRVVAYGAAAKGNTLLNFAGIKADLLSCVFDSAHSKQGKFLPGSHIPILSPSRIDEYKPDFIIILPWNISSEIIKKYSSVSDWNCSFLIIIPSIEIIR